MALTDDLIQQFVKATKDDTAPNKETVEYGTIVISDGVIYVQLDGSTQYHTPVTPTIDVKHGDRVMVTNKDHSLIVTSNISDPSASGEAVGVVGNKVVALDSMLNVKYLEVDGELKAESARIGTLEADNATINGTLKAHEGIFDSLDSTYATFEHLEAEYAKFDTVEALSGSFRNLEADYAEFNKATIEDLEAHSAVIENLDVNYANIDFANIGKAALEEFFAKAGMTENMTIGDATVTGSLIAVTFKGDLIEAGTLKADRLLILGEDGFYYRLNVTENGDPTVTERYSREELQNGILGEVIIAKSVTADKISVSDLSAFKATIAGIEIADENLHSFAKTSVDNTTAGFFLGKDGQFSVGDTTNYLKFYKQTDGTFVLDVAASGITFATPGGGRKSVVDVDATASDADAAATDATNAASTAKATADTAKATADTASANASSATSTAGEAQQTANDASVAASAAQGAANDANTKAEEAKNAADTANSRLGVIDGYIDIVPDESKGGPYIEIGDRANTNASKLKLTDSKLAFVENQEEVAWMTGQKLHISNAKIEHDLEIGGFVWTEHATSEDSSGKILKSRTGLLWKGGN